MTLNEQDPWLKVLRCAAGEYIEWHQEQYKEGSSGWWRYSISGWKIREILKDRTINAMRYDDVVALINEEILKAHTVAKIAARLQS